MPDLYAVIPAAGGGTRFGRALPKQYAMLAGQPVLAHALDRLQQSLPLHAVVVAIASDDAHYGRAIGARAGIEGVRCGGGSRSETVRNALHALVARCRSDDWILVHDAARPCVPRDALLRLVEALRDDAVGGLLALPLADTLKLADRAGEAGAVVAATQDRSRLWRAQTPQMFRFGVLKEALDRDAAGTATDEAQAVERLGHRPRLVLGSAENIKVTYPDDLALAAAILGAQGGTSKGNDFHGGAT